jgi:ADP-heptose:LPS heptosyltransferase
MNPPKKILIVRTDRIGDVVLSLPLAAIIKNNIPEAHVSFLVREYTAPLVKHNKYVDEVIALSEKNDKAEVVKNVGMLKSKFDACIVAFPTYSIALILFLSRIKIRIGSGYRWYSFLFNRKVYEHRKYGERHELEYNVRLLEQIGISEKIDRANVDFGFHLIDDSVNERIKDKLIELGWNGKEKIIIVHPGSGGSAVDLPAYKMKTLVQKLSGEPEVVLVITGSTDEAKLCNSLVVSRKVINTAGMFNLEELIALINYSQILIANSTGPIHIAAALCKNVVGFYPKFAAVSPQRWGPYTNKAKIFQPTVCNNDCTRQKCETINCMESIDIDKVFSAVKEILDRS